ncbi:MAG: serine/threonine-protein kinase [Acidobacteriota bacterium]|nr:serine/threonine-protein kinase [Acidobacteriota bacterium]
MKPELSSHILQDIVERALALPEGQRPAFLQDACEGDESLFERTRSLLGFGDADPECGPADRAPETIGPYRIGREIGRGGMGSVYLAVHSDDELERPVAVKILRRGMDTDELLQRFYAEREILARLHHPHIAQLISGGTTTSGLPYFVMEYVDGEPIHQYCDRRKLGTEARIRLFLKVCGAVQFAHRNLVIHRDIKPGNIPVDTRGNPKLLDFGIAKVIHPGHERTLNYTRTGARMMTPEYASPEQIMGGDITTAADIYSLGVVLYELLTGHRPHGSDQLTPEAWHRQSTTQTPRPSTVIDRRVTRHGTDGGRIHLTPEVVSAARGCDPRKLRRQLQGDLDTILLTALRGNPEERYASPEQLADDLGRYLDGYPIMARRDTLYHLGLRLFRMHRRRLWLLVASVLLLLAGWAYHGQRERVRQQREQHANLRDVFLENIAGFDPMEGKFGKSVEARTYLDDILNVAAARLAYDPESLAAVYNTTGMTFLNLGEPDRALNAFGKVLNLGESVLGDHLEIARANSHISEVLYWLGDTEGALQFQQKAIAVRRRKLGNNHEDTARSMAALCMIYLELGSLVQSLHYLEESETILCALEDPDPELRVENLMLRAGINYRHGPVNRHGVRECASCEDSLNEALQVHRHGIGKNDGTLVELLITQWVILKEKGKREPAEKAITEARTIMDTLVDLEHPSQAGLLRNLGNFYYNHAEHTKGIQMLTRSVAITARYKGEYHPDMLTAYDTLGRYLNKLRHYLEAAEYYEKTLAIALKMPSITPLELARIYDRTGHNYTALGEYKKAEKLMRTALNIRTRQIGADSYPVSLSLVRLTKLSLERGRYAEAEASALEAARLILEYGHFMEPNYIIARMQQAKAVIFQNRLQEGEALLDAFEADLTEVEGPDSIHFIYSRHIRAYLLMKQGRYGEAIGKNNHALCHLADITRKGIPPFLTDIYLHQAELYRMIGRQNHADHFAEAAEDLRISY